MLPRILAPTLALAIAALAPAATRSEAPQATPRLVAVGDVHGSLSGLTGILQAAGLIDGSHRWIGGTARLVQNGDFTDRGADVRAVFELLMRLQDEARRAGGRVDVIFGNHEGMNVIRDVRDVAPSAYATFADARSDDRQRRALRAHEAILRRRGADVDREAWLAAHPPGYIEYWDAMGPSGRYGRWIRSLAAVVRVDDTILMHAGVPPGTTMSVEGLNEAVRRDIKEWDGLVAALSRQGLASPTFTLQDVIDAAQVEIGRIAMAQRAGEPLGDHVTPAFISELRKLPGVMKSTLIDGEGPLWYRGLATLPDTDTSGVEALLRPLGARRFVIGHTPQLPSARITPRFGGRVVAIDTGMLASHYKGGQPSALEILPDGTLTAIYLSAREPLGSPR